MKNSKPIPPWVGPALKPLAQPFFFNKDNIDPVPSCPIKWDKYLPGYTVAFKRFASQKSFSLITYTDTKWNPIEVKLKI